MDPTHRPTAQNPARRAARQIAPPLSEWKFVQIAEADDLGLIDRAQRALRPAVVIVLLSYTRAVAASIVDCLRERVRSGELEAVRHLLLREELKRVIDRGAVGRIEL